MTDTSPGWYKDPADPAVQRYWDGEGWLGDPIAADAPAPAGPPPGATAPDWSRPKPPATPAPAQPATAQPATAQPATAPDAAGEPLPPPPDIPRPVALPPGMPLPPGSITLPPDAVPPGTLPPGAIPVLLPPGLRFATLPTIARPEVRPHGFAIAPLWSRLVARLIDIGLVLVLNVLVNGWFAYEWWERFFVPYYNDFMAQSQLHQPTGAAAGVSDSTGLQIVILLLAAALWFAYEVPATANSGQTIGKRVMRIKVIRLDEPEPLGVARAIRRWNPLGLPTLLWSCCGIGLVLQLVDGLSPTIDWPLHRALHDRSAGTVVVRVHPPATPSHTAPSTDTD